MVHFMDRTGISYPFHRKLMPFSIANGIGSNNIGGGSHHDRVVLTHGPDEHLPGGPTSIGAPIPHANPCPIDGAQLLLS